MPPPSPKAKMLESLRIPDGEGMPSPYNHDASVTAPRTKAGDSRIAPTGEFKTYGDCHGLRPRNDISIVS